MARHLQASKKHFGKALHALLAQVFVVAEEEDFQETCELSTDWFAKPHRCR
jgi:hypothetical protein